MDQNIEAAVKDFCRLSKSGIELLIALHIAGDQRCTWYLLGQLPHKLFHALLISQSQSGALSSQSLSDGPGDRAVIGHTENKRVLSFQERHKVLLLPYG